MHPILRIIVGVVTGILASFVIVAVIEVCSVRGAPGGAAPPAPAPARVARLAALCVAGSVAGQVTVAHAGSVPSEWWQERMNRDFAARGAVRASGAFGRIEIASPHAEPAGLRAESILPVRSGPIALTFAENDPSLVPWSQIERVDVPTSATGFGALLGGAAGAGIAIAMALAENDPTSSSHVWRPAAIIAGGLGVGAAIGSSMRQWHAYYPPPDRGLRVRPIASAK